MFSTQERERKPIEDVIRQRDTAKREMKRLLKENTIIHNQLTAAQSDIFTLQMKLNRATEQESNFEQQSKMWMNKCYEIENKFQKFKLDLKFATANNITYVPDGSDEEEDVSDPSQMPSTFQATQKIPISRAYNDEASTSKQYFRLDKKKFGCSECNYSNDKKANLRLHMKSHAIVQNCQEYGCNKYTKHIDTTMRRHYLLKHPGVAFPWDQHYNLPQDAEQEYANQE